MTASDANPLGAALPRALTPDEHALLVTMIRSDDRCKHLVRGLWNRKIVAGGHQNEFKISFLGSAAVVVDAPPKEMVGFDNLDGQIRVDAIFTDEDGVLGNLVLQIDPDSLDLRSLRAWKVDGSKVHRLPVADAIRMTGSGRGGDPNDYDDTYATCERTKAALLIYSERLTADEITQRLGFDPTYAKVKSEQVNPNRPQSAIRKRHLWFYDTERLVPSLDVRRHVDHVLERLAGKAEALQALRAETGVTIRFSCSWWSRYGQGGPELWPRQLRALADLDLGIEFVFADYHGDD